MEEPQPDLDYPRGDEPPFTEGVGGVRNGGGGRATVWSDQPRYARRDARSSLAGTLVAGLVAIVLFLIPVLWGVGALSAFAQGFGLRLDAAELWLLFVLIVLFIAGVVWFAWVSFTQSVTGQNQYPR